MPITISLPREIKRADHLAALALLGVDPVDCPADSIIEIGWDYVTVTLVAEDEHGNAYASGNETLRHTISIPVVNGDQQNASDAEPEATVVQAVERTLRDLAEQFDGRPLRLSSQYVRNWLNGVANDIAEGRREVV